MFSTILKELIQTSRPRFWLYLAGPVLIANGLTTNPVSWLIFAYFLFPANLILYGINDIFDTDTDKLNVKKSTQETRVQQAQQRNNILIGIVLSVILGAVILTQITFISSILFISWLIVSIGYSTPPVRFKATPVLDSLSNVLYILPGIGAYTLIHQALPPIEILVSGALWTMAMHLYSAIPDQVPDAAAGIRTSAVVLGTRGSLIVCSALWLVSALSASMFSPWGALLFLYPIITLWLMSTAQPMRVIDATYWKFPFINAFVGMCIYGAYILS